MAMPLPTVRDLAMDTRLRFYPGCTSYILKNTQATVWQRGVLLTIKINEPFLAGLFKGKVCPMEKNTSLPPRRLGVPEDRGSALLNTSD
jgi:hypothetical protein